MCWSRDTLSCTGGLTCDPADLICKGNECTSSPECTTDLIKPICNTRNRLCYPCVNDEECYNKSLTTPYCINDKCMECKSVFDCSNSNGCRGNLCQECTSNDDCTPFYCNPENEGGRQICHYKECDSNVDCLNKQLPMCTNAKCFPCQVGVKKVCDHFGLGFFCNSGTCTLCNNEKKCPEVITITQDRKKPELIILKFNKEMLLQGENLRELIEVNFEGVDPSDFTYDFKLIDSYTIHLNIHVKKTLLDPILQINITQPFKVRDIEDITIRKTYYVQGIETIQYISEAELLLTEQLTSATETAASAMLASSMPLLVSPAGSAILWALMNILQTFYYLLFINIYAVMNLLCIVFTW